MRRVFLPAAAALALGCSMSDAPAPAAPAEKPAPAVIVATAAPAAPLYRSDPKLSVRFSPYVERKIFDLTNAERTRRGLNPLVWSDAAVRAARYQSECLARSHVFDHETVPCGTLQGRLDEAGVAFQGTENLETISHPVLPERVAEESMMDWMKSPHHRENVLSDQVTDLGVGVYQDGPRTYATQVFLVRVACGRATLPCCKKDEETLSCFEPAACDLETRLCVK